MSIKDYLAIISGSLAVIIALILLLISFKAKYRRRIFTFRLAATILSILGLLSLLELVD